MYSSSMKITPTVLALWRQIFAALPDSLRGIAAKTTYPVTYSDILEEEARRLGL